MALRRAFFDVVRGAGADVVELYFPDPLALLEENAVTGYSVTLHWSVVGRALTDMLSGTASLSPPGLVAVTHSRNCC